METSSFIEENKKAREALSNIIPINDLTESEYQANVTDIHNHLIHVHEMLTQQDEKDKLLNRMDNIIKRFFVFMLKLDNPTWYKEVEETITQYDKLTKKIN